MSCKCGCHCCQVYGPIPGLLDPEPDPKKMVEEMKASGQFDLLVEQVKASVAQFTTEDDNPNIERGSD